MQKPKTVIIKIQIAALIILVFFTIAAMQTYYNLQGMLSNPSDGWGRSMTIKEKVPNKKAASIYLEKENAEILAANGTDFEYISLFRETAEYKSTIISIKDAQPDKVSQMDWCKEYIVWMENYDLYYSAANSDGSYSEKRLIHKDARGFQLLKGESLHDLIVAKDNSIAIYKLSEGTINQISSDFEISDIRGVSFVKDNAGVFHIAAFSSEDDLLYPIKYLTFADGEWKLHSEHTEKYMSRSWRIINIDIGIDDNDAYIFYHLRKWDSYGLSSRVYMSIFPLFSSINPMEFEKFSVFEEEKNLGSTFIGEPTCFKKQNDTLRLALIKDSYDQKLKEGYTIYLLTLDNGEIVEREKIVQDRKWISSIYVAENSTGIAISYLDTAGKGQSEVLYNDSNKGFVQAAGQPQWKDYLYAFLDIIPGYVIGLFLGLVRGIVFIPAIAWVLFVEIFEIRKFKKKPLVVNRIALIIYAAIKFLTVNAYYSPSSIELMPSILKFSGAQYFYAAVTMAFALLIAKLFKRSKPDMHNIAEFIIFILFDVTIMTFVYTGYLTQ